MIAGVGVENHGEFHELVQSRLSNLIYNRNTVEREKAVFEENDVRIPTDTN